jgi:hypothetical protein
MAAGHFLMAFDVSFLIALLCLLTGVGCFKGNIASQVGALYARASPKAITGTMIGVYYLQDLAGRSCPEPLPRLRSARMARKSSAYCGFVKPHFLPEDFW